MSTSTPIEPSEVASAAELSARRGQARGRDRVTGAIIALALLAAAALSARRLYSVASGPTPPASGEVAPEFTAQTLDGAGFSSAALAGDVVLLDFWATWCPPCVASLPALDRIQDRFSDQGFTVLGVNQEPQSIARTRAFVASRELGFPMVVDPGYVAGSYGVHSLPTSFLVDRKGVIRATFRGAPDEDRLASLIEAVLEEQASAP